MRVLLVGFGAFPGAPLNPSALLVKSLARRRRPAFAEVVRTTHVFATTYAAVDSDLPKLLALGPDVVLMFGLAGRRRHLCIENAGAQRRLAPFSRCARIPPAAGRYQAGRARGSTRRSALRKPARRGARELCAGAAVARCRALSLQLCLLAGAGTVGRRPAAGSVRSYSAGFRRPAPAVAWPPSAPTRQPCRCCRATPRCAHRCKPPLTAPAG